MGRGRVDGGDATPHASGLGAALLEPAAATALYATAGGWGRVCLVVGLVEFVGLAGVTL